MVEVRKLQNENPVYTVARNQWRCVEERTLTGLHQVLCKCVGLKLRNCRTT